MPLGTRHGFARFVVRGAGFVVARVSAPGYKTRLSFALAVYAGIADKDRGLAGGVLKDSIDVRKSCKEPPEMTTRTWIRSPS